MTPKLKLNNNINWTKRTIDSLFDLKKGEMLEKELITPEGKYEYFNGGVKNSGRTDKFNTFKNTISVIVGGSCGYVRLADKNFFCGQSNCTLNLLDPLELDLKFAYYALKSQQERIEALAFGTTIQNIRISDLKELEIPFTSNKNEQHAIANTLSVFDERLENLASLIEINRKLRDEYAHKLFSLDEAFLSHWKLEALQSQMHEITLGEIFNFKSGKYLKSEERLEEEKFPYYGAGIDNTGFVAEPNTEKDTISIISNGYSLGNIRYHEIPWFNGTGSIALEPMNNEIYVPFFYCALKYLQKDIKERMKSDDSPFLSLKLAGEIKVPYVKSFQLQRKAGKIVFLLDQKLDQYKKELSSLTVIRDTLLKKLFPDMTERTKSIKDY
ncbi:restriction endonuclease subunit S [Mycoplasmoides genitalium]